MPWIRTVPAEEATGPLKEFGGQREGDMVERARRFDLPLHAGTYEHLAAEGAS